TRLALQATLPFYMVPGRFVYLDRFPLNANGKIDYRALRELDVLADRTARGPAGGPDQAGGAAANGPPVATHERALAAIWSTILERDGIKLEDRFFELGGHSLAAARIASEVRANLGVEISIRNL